MTDDLQRGMNILFTCSARKWGGNEAWVLNAAHVLQQRHNVWLAYRSPAIGERFSIPSWQLPFLNEADLYTLARLVSIIRQHRIDVVVPTKRKDYVLAGLACRLTGASNILILGIVRKLENTFVNDLVYNRLADGIMVNAKMIREVLLESPFMQADKVGVVANGLSIDASTVVPARRRYGFTVTSLAELSERKGFDFLIRGFARFVREHGIRDAGLVIMGTGGQRESLEALARALDIERMVTFTGFVRDPYPELLASDAFALTSKNEGLPYATIEAALLGNAVITTRAGGIEELLQDGVACLYADYGDEATLADQLFRVYSDEKLRKRLADNARAAFLESYSLEKMERDMIAFFQHIRGNKRITA